MRQPLTPERPAWESPEADLSGGNVQRMFDKQLQHWSSKCMEKVEHIETLINHRVRGTEERLMRKMDEITARVAKIESDGSNAAAKMLSIEDELRILSRECLSQSGRRTVSTSSAHTSEASPELRDQILSIRQAMSSSASSTDRKVSDLTELTREITSELAILRGRFDAIGDRPDLAAQIAVNASGRDREDRRGRQSSQASVSSDSDISHLRPRSVSAERPASGPQVGIPELRNALRPSTFQQPSSFKQFTVDSSQLLRSYETAGAFSDSGGPRGYDSHTTSNARHGGHAALASGTHGTGSRVEDPLLRPRHSLAQVAPILDSIAEARPSMERPSTQGSTSARPSMERPSAQGLTSARPSTEMYER